MDTQVFDTVCAIFSFILGAMVGSFLNVCVYRIPKGESIVSPPSHCPKCDEPIAWYDNIPILSWLVLGAKCRHCRVPISWQYPTVEAITGALFLVAYWRFGFVVATPVYMLLLAGLVLVTFVDLTDWTIPDEVTLPGIFIGLACSVTAMFFPQTGLRIPYLYDGVFDALLGVLVGGGSLYLLDKLTLLLMKKRGMGFGDVKLNAMLGAFLGWKGVLLVIVTASFVGSVIGLTMVAAQKIRGEDKVEHYLPFGPYLSIAGVIVLFFGPNLVELYQAWLDI